MADTKPNLVMLMPTSSTPDTAPPASPWYLAVRRLWALVLPLLPLIIDALIGLYQTGGITAPSKYTALITTAVVLWQTVAKQQKEQGRQNVSNDLRAQGLPMGEPFRAGDLHAVLYSDKTILDARMPIARP
ncbi:MAG TPA: hypothetical protein VNM48_01620 [Chloroflexota bacterium]|nr:hypothetical protein [Chloroflexota bacterium]